MEISCSENTSASQGKAIKKLGQGVDIEKQLQIPICKSSSGENEKSMNLSPGDIPESMSNSFTHVVSVINSAEISEFNQSPASITSLLSVDSEGSSKSAARVKNRRGCYKRRKTEDTWSTETLNWAADGRAWRKYGRKFILNCKYEREYYRCTHHLKGCPAKKNVQQIRDDPLLYRTTYDGHHTCQDLIKPSDQMILDDYYGADAVDFSGILNFDNSQPQNNTIFNHFFCSSSLSVTQEHNNAAHDYHVMDCDLTQNNYSESCPVTKQVQQIRDDPPLYRTTYHGHHTRQDLMKSSDQLILDDYYGADAADSSGLLNFDNSQPQNNTFFSSSISVTQGNNDVANDYHVVDCDLTQNKPSSSDYLSFPDELASFGSSYDNADIISWIDSSTYHHNFDMGSFNQFEEDVLKQYGF